ncbi:MAG: T9SS type A sorting domain-containing protein [Bacteroidota bacterium]|nr:T9SS type A sorting domain-containing protein [Bacteroidota bacterium]
MKAKFTLLAALFLLTTSIYALEPAHNKSRKLTGSFLKNRLERTEKSTEHSPFQRKMSFQKQANSLKSAQAIKQRLDSYTSQEWDEFTNQWVIDEKVEFTYDDKWNVTLERYSEWNGASSQWILDSKYESTYDAKGNMTQQIEYNLNEINQFLADEKSIYSYDANGNLTQHLDYRWNGNTNTFVIDSKNDYAYDANGNLIQEINSSLDETTNKLVGKDKYEYKYNDNGKMSQSFSSYWNQTTNQWIQNNKTEYTYDSKGNNTIVLGTSLNGLDQWYDSSKSEYTYDDKGQLTQQIYSSKWTGSWIEGDKNTYLYDDFGNIAQQISYYNRDGQTNQWTDINKSENTYDNRYSFNDLILPWGDDEYFNNFFRHMITEMRGYEWNIYTKQWILNFKAAIVYSPINVTSVNQLDTELSRVYPNPVSEFVSFNLPDSYSQFTFELFDLQGRKLISKAIGSNEKVNMEGFQSGLYLYKLNVDGMVQSGKLVKE